MQAPFNQKLKIGNNEVIIIRGSVAEPRTDNLRANASVVSVFSTWKADVPCFGDFINSRFKSESTTGLTCSKDTSRKAIVVKADFFNAVDLPFAIPKRAFVAKKRPELAVVEAQQAASLWIRRWVEFTANKRWCVGVVDRRIGDVGEFHRDETHATQAPGVFVRTTTSVQRYVSSHVVLVDRVESVDKVLNVLSVDELNVVEVESVEEEKVLLVDSVESVEEVLSVDSVELDLVELLAVDNVLRVEDEGVELVDNVDSVLELGVELVESVELLRVELVESVESVLELSVDEDSVELVEMVDNVLELAVELVDNVDAVLSVDDDRVEDVEKVESVELLAVLELSVLRVLSVLELSVDELGVEHEGLLLVLVERLDTVVSLVLMVLSVVSVEELNVLDVLSVESVLLLSVD